MKRILSTLFLLITVIGVPSLTLAATNVGALLSIDTQWDQSGSPYIIQARVLVPPGVTLKIEPGVQVVFQGPSTLQISGDLKVNGSAAAPAVMNMMDGGLQSALLIDGGDVDMSNVKVLGGVFLGQDATIRMDASEVTKGSGLYLKGTTVAHLKNNKFYGNATGVVLDGPVEADMQFNTLVQNTYGLYLKDYAKLVFLNNSVHDNESEVVNNSTATKLGGNYWGTMSPTSVKNKIKGTVSLSPMKDLKDILRAYLRSELPVITKGMSDQAEAEDKRADQAAREALKAFRQKQSQSDVLGMEAKMKTMTPATTPTPTVPTATPVPMAPTPTATLVVMQGDLSAPAALPTVPAVPTPVPTAVPAAAVAPPPAPVAVTPAVPEPPALGAGMPAPPMLPSSAYEPPALGNLAGSMTPVADANAAPVATIAVLPTTQPSGPASPTPTPGLGSGTVSSDDLASIVATAQAASTASTPAPASAAPMVAPAPAVSAPSAPSEAIAAPPMPPDLTSVGSPDSSAMAATSVPTVASTATFTMTSTAVPMAATDTPTFTATSTFTAVSTDTPTFTPTVMIPTPTFTSVPPVTLAPPANVVPAADMGMAIPAPAAPAAASIAPPAPPIANAVAAPAAPSVSQAPAVPKDAVPPPPDFGDNSANSGIQPPAVNVPDASSAPAASAQSAAPKPTADVDVDGMQAPPMDSGLDFSGPKK